MKQRIIKSYISYMYNTIIIISLESKKKVVPTVWLHVHEIEKQTNQIYGIKIQASDYI